MRGIALLVLLTPLAFATVDGVVTNVTTGKPQPGATVTLYQLASAGMESIESVKTDAQGVFRMDRNPQGPHLIQTAYDGVTYNHMLPPGSPATGLKLDVYNSSTKPSGAKVSQHMILVEPTSGELGVNESIIYQNDGKITYNDPDKGTLHIYLPPETQGKVSVRATAPQGMPIERAAVKTSQPNIYMVDFPIKPGETRFDLTYSIPFSSPGTFSGRVLHSEGPVRIIAPQGVTIEGDGLTTLGQEPTTQATIYDVKGNQFKVQIQGTGSLHRAEAADEEDGGEGIQQISARIYDHLYSILGLSLLILLLGFLLLYRRGSLAPPAAPAPQPHPRPQAHKGKRH